MKNIKIEKSNSTNQSADLEAIWTDSQGLQWKITVDWKASQSGSRIQELSISAHKHTTGLTCRVLQQIPLGELAKSERENTFKNGLAHKAFQHGGHRRVPLSDQELKEVSRLYIEAKTTGKSTQKHIAEYLKISIPTASRRISLAQQRGFIKTNSIPKSQKKGNK